MSQKSEQKVSTPSTGGKKKEEPVEDKENKNEDANIEALDEGDIAILKTYVRRQFLHHPMRAYIYLLTRDNHRVKDLTQRR